MDLIDEDGRLFGYVNVVDGAVVLLVVSVLLAGTVLVLSSSSFPASTDPVPEETKRIVITAESVPSPIGSLVSSGTEFTGRMGETTVDGTILDTYISSANDRSVQVVVLASLPNISTRIGQKLFIQTDSYRLNGTVSSRDERRHQLPVEQTDTLVETTLTPRIARSIQVGDAYRVGNRTVAHVASKQTVPTLPNTTRHVRLRLRVRALRTQNELRFAGQPLTLGRTLRFETAQYSFESRIVDIGNRTFRATNRTVETVVERTVPESIAADIDAGDQYVVDGQPVATVRTLDVYTAPAEGNVTVRMGLDLQEFSADETSQYLGKSVVRGNRIPFETEAGIRIDPTVVRVGTVDTGVSEGEMSVLTTLELPTSTADAIAQGDTFRRNGRRIATVESIEAFPTQSATRKRVRLGLRLRTATLQPENETRFLGREVRNGQDIPFRTDEYSLLGTVISIGSFDAPGESTKVTTELSVSNVPPTVADDIEPGMSIRRSDSVVAQVQSVSVEPATVVLETNDGNIYRRDHPVNKDVTLTVRLQVRETRSGLWYNGQPLQIGTPVILDFGVVRVEGNVASVRR